MRLLPLVRVDDPIAAVDFDDRRDERDDVLADVADPVADEGEAVIAIKAAALNFFDILMIQGKYQIKPPFPFSPGAEVAGVIRVMTFSRMERM